MKALFLDTVNKNTKVVDVNDLQDYYDLIGCDYVDIVSRKIGRNYYEVICDDEGTFVSDPLISAIDDFGRPMLVGSLIICGKADGEGNLTSLTNSQIKAISKRINTLYTNNHPEGLLMISGMGY